MHILEHRRVVVDLRQWRLGVFLCRTRETQETGSEKDDKVNERPPTYHEDVRETGVGRIVSNGSHYNRKDVLRPHDLTHPSLQVGRSLPALSGLPWGLSEQ